MPAWALVAVTKFLANGFTNRKSINLSDLDSQCHTITWALCIAQWSTYPRSQRISEWKFLS